MAGILERYVIPREEADNLLWHAERLSRKGHQKDVIEALILTRVEQTPEIMKRIIDRQVVETDEPKVVTRHAVFGVTGSSIPYFTNCKFITDACGSLLIYNKDGVLVSAYAAGNWREVVLTKKS